MIAIYRARKVLSSGFVRWLVLGTIGRALNLARFDHLQGVCTTVALRDLRPPEQGHCLRLGILVLVHASLIAHVNTLRKALDMRKSKVHDCIIESEQRKH